MIDSRDAIFSNNVPERANSQIQDWDFHGADTNCHLHGLHPYPARFIPQIPRKAIQEWSESGDLILDPFCGCGTTLLEGSLLGRRTIGIDNNAVALLVSKAKTIQYLTEDLESLKSFTSSLDERIESATNSECWYPDYESCGYWFDDRAIYDLGRLKALIDKMSGRPHILASAVFSSIIVRISFQDSDTRYARKPYDYAPDFAIKTFKNKMRDAIVRASELIDTKRTEAEVIRGDSRNLAFLQDSTINLIVTSPPYLNAYDYHKYHRHRLHWIGGDVKFARDTEIGKHDVFTRPHATPDQYFVDMEQCFGEWSRVLKKNGKALVVIGDAIVSGKPVHVADIFVEIAKKYGLSNPHWWIRKLDVNKKSFNQHARINMEHVLLFEKE
ncbi:DNA methylase [anaerobic digester metagenome]